MPVLSVWTGKRSEKNKPGNQEKIIPQSDDWRNNINNKRNKNRIGTYGLTILNYGPVIIFSEKRRTWIRIPELFSPYIQREEGQGIPWRRTGNYLSPPSYARRTHPYCLPSVGCSGEGIWLHSVFPVSVPTGIKYPIFSSVAISGLNMSGEDTGSWITFVTV